MLLPAGLGLVGRAVMWRDWGQRQDSEGTMQQEGVPERQKCSLCTLVCFAPVVQELPSRGL